MLYKFASILDSKVSPAINKFHYKHFKSIYRRAVAARWGLGGGGGLQPPQTLTDQLTLSQPGGADYAHHSTTVLTMLKYVPAALSWLGRKPRYIQY